MRGIPNNNVLIPAAIVLAGGLIASSMFLPGGGGGAASAVSSQGDSFGNRNSGAAENIRPVDGSDHVRGNRDAPVAIVEFSDFECPFCRQLHPTLTQVLADFEGDVKWVYRHFPLTQIHSRALTASLASECAAELGGNDAFWAFADGVFENQRQMGSPFYEELAGELGIERGAFAQCLDAQEHVSVVEQDLRDAVSSGGRGTPYVVVINGSGEVFPFSGALPYEQVRSIVEQAIASS